MKLRVFSFTLSLILIVGLISFVFIPDGNAAHEKSLKSASGSILFKITPGSAIVKIEKHKKFHLKQNKNGKLVNAKKSFKGLIWSVNGIPWGGNGTYGTINKSGVYQSPKSIPSPSSVTISVSGLSGNYELTPSTVTVVRKNITGGGKLALKVIWISGNKITPLAEGGIPEDVKQVIGHAVNDKFPEQSFDAGPVDVAARTLAFSDVPLDGTYTVTLEGLDASVPPNVIYRGTVTGVHATPIGEASEPAIIYLTLVDGVIEVSAITPQIEAIAEGETQQFSVSVTGAFDPTGKPVEWQVTGGNSFGTITSGGLYKAPSTVPTPSTATIRATSKADPSKFNEITFTIFEEVTTTTTTTSTTTTTTSTTTSTTSTTTTTTSTTTTTIAGSMVLGKVTDVQTQAPIEGALVEIISSPGSGGSVSKNTLTDVNGSYTLEVLPGQYDLTISEATYKDFTASNLTVSSGSVILDAALSPNTLTIAVGSVSGKVTDNTGAPVNGAVVQIDGGAHTNGIFAATNTDNNGFYTIDSIPVKDTTGVPIPSFTVMVAMSGFESANRTGVVVNANTSTANIDFTLAPVIANNVIFKDDFETNTEWMTDGFWHRIQNGSGIKNILVPDYVTLSPDDTSEGAIPNAFSGEVAYWYGEDSTGSYIGQQKVGDSLLSGGTSLSSNFGTLTSPVIDLTSATMPVLRFWSWWEIEGVEPNASGFDIMGIKVSETGGETFTEIMKLNPFADPVENNRDDKPYTSAGFFKTPVWSFYEIDLSSYAGKSIVLQFEFGTQDELFNGFRGWFIDDLTVEDLSITD